MADDHKDRPTSYAKSVDGLVQNDSSLDRALSLKEHFQKAQNQHQQAHQAEQVKDGAQRGSQGKAPAPGQHLRMRGPLGATVDRKEHTADFRKLDTTEKQKQESARKAQEAFKNRQQPTRDHEQDRDRDY